MFFVVVGDMKDDGGRGANPRSVTRSPRRGRCRPACCRRNRSRPRRAKIIEEAPIELGHFHFSWHIPELRHPDVPVLDVLATLLGSGRSSRLYQEVREKKGVVHSVDAWTYSPGNPGLFGMSALVDAGQIRAGARRDARGNGADQRPNSISPEEVGKAVKQFIAGTLATRKTMQGQAQDLGGNWLAANDLNFSERYLAAVKRVTPADLQRVAPQYLTAGKPHALRAAAQRHRAESSRSQRAKSTANMPIQKFELANGLRLLVKEDHRLPFVEFRAVFQGRRAGGNSRRTTA